MENPARSEAEATGRQPFGLVGVAARPVASLADALRARLAALGGEMGEVQILSAEGETLGAVAAEITLPPEAAPQLRQLLDLEDEIDAFLGPVAAMQPARVLISDMDSTIIGQECIDEIADAIGLKPQIAEITERAMRGELDFEAALTSRVAMLKGLPLPALQRTFEERLTLNPGARTLIRTVRAMGHRTLLVSGGFTFFTSRIAALAGFEHDLGNTLGDDGAVLTGEVARPILGREAKRRALEEAAGAAGSPLVNTIALGDGANDLGMIRAAGIGVAYHAKPVVAAEANASIRHTDLTAALFFQRYTSRDFVRD
ncbi:phosphoserine phosphatase SerB [Hyphomonas sp.]|uniref:phosphoserine phosphatase SerB n=1 Tax=Hyphomonas sp. TaxID=87 RepID=UPI00391AF6F7